MSDIRNDGRQGPQAQQPQANLSVLAQYVKDLSFENPGAPQSLRGRQTSPTINISINVHGGQIVNNEVESHLAQVQDIFQRGGKLVRVCRDAPSCPGIVTLDAICANVNDLPWQRQRLCGLWKKI